MRKIIVPVSGVFLFAVVVALAYAPDMLSRIIIGIMSAAVAFGYWFGIIPVVQYIGGFRLAQVQMEQLQTIQASTSWVAIRQNEDFFHQKTLDLLFTRYKETVARQEENGQLISDIENVINEESLSLRSWQVVMVQLPGTLTALGLLGTFIGLVIGISGIGFSSIDSAVSSIEVLLGGIRTAFYTSVIGVILSILFNLSYRLVWNYMLRELGLFIETFHAVVLPSMEEQKRVKDSRDTERMIALLNRLPKQADYSMAAGAVSLFASTENEKRLMPELRTALKNGEFDFQIRARCTLNGRKVCGGAALLKWTKPGLGEVTPETYLPAVEKNGYLATIHRSLWEEVCKAIRTWIDAGIRPVPLSVPVSKVDILSMDVTAVLKELAEKYAIPPQYLAADIPAASFLECGDFVQDAVQQLRRNGFGVILDGFDGDFVVLNTIPTGEVDQIRLDLRILQSEKGKKTQRIQEIFNTAEKFRFPMFAGNVESAEEYAALGKAGCTEGEGTYLYPLMTAEEFEAKIRCGE